MEQAIKFESIIILIPNITEEQKQEVIATCKNLMDNENTQIQDLGIRKLAYKVQGNKEGRYMQFNYKQDPNNIGEIEKYFRKEEKIIKFLTTREEEN